MSDHIARKRAAARHLRRRQTLAEALLWSALRRTQLGLPFRRQHVIGPFIVDFCCLPAQLIVEVDGDIHDLDEVCEQDSWRADYLKDRGFMVLRVSNDDVRNHIDRVIAAVRARLDQIGS